MSSLIKRYQSKIKNLSDNLEVIKKNIISQNRFNIIKYYQEHQIGMGLKKGTRKDAIVIGWYTKKTEEISRDPHRKPRTGLVKYQGDRYDMEWTGKFFDGMYIYYEDKYSFSIGSTDPKTSKLIAKYNDIFTLTDATMKQVEENYITKKFSEELEKRLSSVFSF